MYNTGISILNPDVFQHILKFSPRLGYKVNKMFHEYSAKEKRHISEFIFDELVSKGMLVKNLNKWHHWMIGRTWKDIIPKLFDNKLKITSDYERKISLGSYIICHECGKFCIKARIRKQYKYFGKSKTIKSNSSKPIRFNFSFAYGDVLKTVLMEKNK